jgi:dihydropyrimidinase
MRTLIAGGTVVTATETTEADVVIEDEKVAAIGRGMSVEADRVIDATGRYVMPGGVDVHTHMELPFGGSFCSDDSGNRPGDARIRTWRLGSCIRRGDPRVRR